ncbi:MAG: SRPBCC domain-containing protein [Candidatus Aquilonibacter sp.]
MNNTSTAPTTLILKHTFNASPERVYKAWTDPLILQEFMRVGGNARVRAETNVRVGGSFRIVMFRADGEEYVARGTYRELVPGQRIVCTWSWEEDDPALERETLLTIEFAPRGTQTEMTLTHENFRDIQQRDNHAMGWGEMLVELERVL